MGLRLINLGLPERFESSSWVIWIYIYFVNEFMGQRWIWMAPRFYTSQWVHGRARMNVTLCVLLRIASSWVVACQNCSGVLIWIFPKGVHGRAHKQLAAWVFVLITNSSASGSQDLKGAFVFCTLGVHGRLRKGTTLEALIDMPLKDTTYGNSNVFVFIGM